MSAACAGYQINADGARLYPNIEPSGTSYTSEYKLMQVECSIVRAAGRTGASFFFVFSTNENHNNKGASIGCTVSARALYDQAPSLVRVSRMYHADGRRTHGCHSLCFNITSPVLVNNVI